jgi:hypothetical protein
MALFALSLCVIPQAATAQQKDSSSSPTPRWEHGIFAHRVDRESYWVAAGGRVIAFSDKVAELIAALGGGPADMPGRRAPNEAWTAAVLNVLGRQGWELVTCQLMWDGGSPTYTCYLKRPVGRSSG